jgi:hypothetical protein
MRDCTTTSQERSEFSRPIEQLHDGRKGSQFFSVRQLPGPVCTIGIDNKLNTMKLSPHAISILNEKISSKLLVGPMNHGGTDDGVGVFLYIISESCSQYVMGSDSLVCHYTNMVTL